MFVLYCNTEIQSSLRDTLISFRINAKKELFFALLFLSSSLVLNSNEFHVNLFNFCFHLNFFFSPLPSTLFLLFLSYLVFLDCFFLRFIYLARRIHRCNCSTLWPTKQKTVISTELYFPLFLWQFQSEIPEFYANGAGLNVEKKDRREKEKEWREIENKKDSEKLKRRERGGGKMNRQRSLNTCHCLNGTCTFERPEFEQFGTVNRRQGNTQKKVGSVIQHRTQLHSHTNTTYGGVLA